MAEGDAIVMNNFKEQLLLGTIDLVNDDFYMALYSTALGSPDGNPVYTTSNEISAANYDAGGKLMTTLAVTQDDTNNWAKWAADDVAWTSLGAASIAASRAYDNTTTPKHVAIEWAISTASNGGNYTLQFGANGILTLS